MRAGRSGLPGCVPGNGKVTFNLDTLLHARGQSEQRCSAQLDRRVEVAYIAALLEAKPVSPRGIPGGIGVLLGRQRRVVEDHGPEPDDLVEVVPVGSVRSAWRHTLLTNRCDTVPTQSLTRRKPDPAVRPEIRIQQIIRWHSRRPPLNQERHA